MIAGYSAEQWLDVYQLCHVPSLTGLIQRDWPDGRPLLNQPYVIPQIFKIISAEYEKAKPKPKKAGK